MYNFKLRGVKKILVIIILANLSDKKFCHKMLS